MISLVSWSGERIIPFLLRHQTYKLLAFIRVSRILNQCQTPLSNILLQLAMMAIMVPQVIFTSYASTMKSPNAVVACGNDRTIGLCFSFQVRPYAGYTFSLSWSLLSRKRRKIPIGSRRDYHSYEILPRPREER